jgi:surfeit locus 1 family protein
MNTRMRAWVVVLATACALALTAGLGFWQLGRAQTKIALQNRILEKNRQDVIVNSTLLAINNEAKWTDMLHRSVRLNGHWLTDRTVYLDNRQMGARQGFFVLTPLRLAGSDAAILVQRGWIPRDFQDRTRLAAVATPAGDAVVSGRIAAAPSAIYALGAEAANENTAVTPSPIRQNLDTQSQSAALKAANLRLLHGVVLQTDAASEGLLRDWPKPDSGVAKHYGYAFQWFGLCATVLVLHVWLVWLAPRRRAAKLAGDSAQQSSLEPHSERVAPKELPVSIVPPK